MKRSSIALSMLLLAGCGQPPATAPTQGSSVPNTTPAAARNSADFAHVSHYTGADHLEDFAAAPAVVARYRSGREGFRHKRGSAESSLRLDRAFRYAVKDVTERTALIEQLRADPDVEFAEPDYRLHATQMPTDPMVASQWELPQIDLGHALDLSTGSGVIVASVDSGVDYNHPDLQGHVIKGWNFSGNNSDPMDDNGHGTHTAGTIGASANNNVGVAGMAPGCQILAVKALDSQGAGNTSDISNAVIYAAQHGAKVINMSLGGPQESSTLHAAIQQAAAAGVLVVAAAGNDGSTTPNYPAAYSEVLSVGATDKNDARASFSTYGSTLGIAAPGTSILSTYKGSYGYMDGTSMASPHVAGVAALVRALHPDWSYTQVRQALVASGDACTGFESSPGVRRLNAFKALQYGGTATPAQPPASTPAPTLPPASTPTPAPVSTPVAAPTAPPTQAPASDLAIQRVQTTNVMAHQVTFRWLTNLPADTQVELTNLHWTSGAYGPLTTSHRMTVNGLAANTWYAYRVHSHAANGASAVSVQGWIRTAAY